MNHFHGNTWISCNQFWSRSARVYLVIVSGFSVVYWILSTEIAPKLPLNSPWPWFCSIPHLLLKKIASDFQQPADFHSLSLSLSSRSGIFSHQKLLHSVSPFLSKFNSTLFSNLFALFFLRCKYWKEKSVVIVNLLKHLIMRVKYLRVQPSS